MSQGGVEGDEGVSVLNMKGLPPSEAMLGRRQIRACSVDLGRAEEQTAAQELAAALGGCGAALLPATAQDDSLPEVARASQAGGPTAMCEPKLNEVLRLPGLAPPLKEKVPTAPTARKVKPVQDAEGIVLGAIMRLQMQCGESE